MQVFRRGEPITPLSRLKRIKPYWLRQPSWLVKIRNWRYAHGTLPRIVKPATFNEKVLHRNLFERREDFTRIADKAAVRRYVEERVGPDLLPRLYHVTTCPETIPFDELPDRFVVKPTHGSGWVKIVRDKATIDRAALLATCRAWLQRDYYRETREIAYRGIQPQILIEEYIDDGSGATPNDYKCFVFGGHVEVIQADVDRFTHHRQLFYSPAWEKLDVRYLSDDISGEVPRPTHLTEMITAAEALCREFEFVRADFYDTRDRLFFGELTLTPNEGCVPFRPAEFDHYLGSLWKPLERRRLQTTSVRLTPKRHRRPGLDQFRRPTAGSPLEHRVPHQRQ